MSAGKRRLLRLLGVAVLAGVAFFAIPLPEPLLHPHQEVSLRLLDREGRLLREVLSTAAGTSRWVSLDRVAPAMAAATVVSEDQRFYYHPGVDLLAVARAARSNLQAGRVVEGGSTLTQQLVRNLAPPGSRSAGVKVQEAFYALRMEWRFSKREILELYLNRVSYGWQTYGIEAAARTYFEKPASELSVAESAFLAVLPRAPESFEPYTKTEEILPFQRQLLERMAKAGAITPEEHRLALQEPLVLARPSGTFQAPHFCDFVLQQQREWGDAASVVTTLDLELQQAVEKLLRSHLAALEKKGVGNGAVVVLEVEHGDVLAMVGSADYGDFLAGGQFNAALGHRQPGSTLKPFTYALLLERGGTPATLLPDIDAYVGQGRFIPSNYDWKFHGPVRLRTALACSYNVAAVRALEEVGVESLLRRLQSLGMERVTGTPEHYGLGLTLGDADVSLLELARAYRALARGGRFGPERLVLRVKDALGNERARPDVPEDPPVLDPRAAYQVTHILADPEARVPAFGRSSPLALPFPCASKTGTSKGFRDNWTVGYTPRYVVAVWVGNNDGRPMVEVSGISGAGPLFRDVMLLLDELDSRGTPAGWRAYPEFPRPERIQDVSVCPVSGMLPGPDCPAGMREVCSEESAPLEPCSVHRRIRVDRRTGLRADASTPPAFAEERLFTVYPPLYRDWMLQAAIPFPPPAPSTGGGGEVRIVFPDDGAVFQLDPVLRPGYQKILLRCVAPEGTPHVRWLVDGASAGEPAAGLSAWWALRRGFHEVVCVATAGGREVRSAPIRIEVRGPSQPEHRPETLLDGNVLCRLQLSEIALHAARVDGRHLVEQHRARHRQTPDPRLQPNVEGPGRQLPGTCEGCQDQYRESGSLEPGGVGQHHAWSASRLLVSGWLAFGKLDPQ